MSITSPKTKRYASLNSRPGTKFRFFVQRSVRKVEKGSLADETCGQHTYNIVRSAAIPTKHRSKLRAYPDFCLRRAFILNSRLQICQFCFNRFMKSAYKQPVHILQSSHRMLAHARCLFTQFVRYCKDGLTRKRKHSLNVSF
jgi:hypothetical protein